MSVYLHNGAMGDIIYSLPVLREQPGVLALTKERQRDFLRPLLNLQPYVENVTLNYPNNGFVDLRKYREISEADLSKHLALCHAEAAGVAVDLETPWLGGVTPKDRGTIVVNRTARYRGTLDYSLLRPYESDVVFLGTFKEWKSFTEETGVTPGLFYTENALDIAETISGSKLFIGNQSLAFSIAEALKHPRVLEVSHTKPNCMPHGAGGETELTPGRLKELCSLEPRN